MTEVYLIDQYAVWHDTREMGLDLGRPPNSVLEKPPEFDPKTHFVAWSGSKWLVRPIGELPVELVTPEPVPVEVSRRQAKRALSDAGYLAAANEAIAAMPGKAGDDARIDWADAGTFRRDNPLILGIGNVLGLASEEIDTLFRQAAAI